MTLKFLHIHVVTWTMGIGPAWAAATESAKTQGLPDSAGGAPSMTDIHDIKPVLSMGVDLQWIYWVMAAVLLLVLSLLLYRILKKRKERAALPLQPPPLPPDAEAYQLLDALAAETNLSPKQFYFQLSAIIRRFIERQFQILAGEMTTEELLPQVDQLPLKMEQSRALKEFCRATDLIKFAGVTAGQNKMARDLAFARDLVHQSTIDATRENVSEAPGPAPVDREPPPALPLTSGKG